jgi:hypothetical protein
LIGGWCGRDGEAVKENGKRGRKGMRAAFIMY